MGNEGEATGAGFPGVYRRAGQGQSPETQRVGGGERERASEAQDLGTVGEILASFRVILTFVSSRAWHIVGVQ